MRCRHAHPRCHLLPGVGRAHDDTLVGRRPGAVRRWPPSLAPTASKRPSATCALAPARSRARRPPSSQQPPACARLQAQTVRRLASGGTHPRCQASHRPNPPGNSWSKEPLTSCHSFSTPKTAGEAGRRPARAVLVPGHSRACCWRPGQKLPSAGLAVPPARAEFHVSLRASQRLNLCFIVPASSLGWVIWGASTGPKGAPGGSVGAGRRFGHHGEARQVRSWPGGPGLARDSPTCGPCTPAGGRLRAGS